VQVTAVENDVSIKNIMQGKYNTHLEKPMCYLSKRPNKQEVNYCPTKLKMASLVWTVQKARAIVDDAAAVVVYTEHTPTIGIAAQTNFKSSTPHKQNLHLVRASLYLSQFNLTMKHVPRRGNIIPDALSRLLALKTDNNKQGLEKKADIYEELFHMGGLENKPDIYEELFHMEPLTSVIHVFDELVEKLQKACMDDPYVWPKFSKPLSQFSH
jgi:hypothetical protein